MKTIMAAVDGSPHALKGVRWAGELAKATGAPLELVYVSFPNLLPPTVYERTIKEVDEAETKHAEGVLAEAERRVADLNLRCQRTRGTGGPAEVLADLADARDVWGVVIGAKGRSALSRALIGSTADRLVHICTKPVVVIR